MTIKFGLQPNSTTIDGFPSTKSGTPPLQNDFIITLMAPITFHPASGQVVKFFCL